MKLTRSGFSRHRGDANLFDREVHAKFDSKTKTVKLEAKALAREKKGSTHDYQLSLTLKEIGRIICALDELSAEDRPVVAAELKPHTRSLLRLTNLSAT